MISGGRCPNKVGGSTWFSTASPLPKDFFYSTSLVILRNLEHTLIWKPRVLSSTVTDDIGFIGFQILFKPKKVEVESELRKLQFIAVARVVIRRPQHGGPNSIPGRSIWDGQSDTKIVFSPKDFNVSSGNISTDALCSFIHHRRYILVILVVAISFK